MILKLYIFLHYADDINGLAGKEQELAKLVESLDKTSSSYGKEISGEKTKLMTNSINDITTDNAVNGRKLDTVKSFKYLGAVVSDQGFKPEICSRIAQTTAALTKLKPIWNDTNINFSSKI